MGKKEKGELNLDGLTAGFLDFLFGRSRETFCFDGDGPGDFPVAQNFQWTTFPKSYSVLGQKFGIEFGVIGQFVQRGQVDDIVFGAEIEVVETAVGKFPVEGHLPTFETDPDAAAGTGGLTLAAATGGFSVAAAFTATDTFAAFDCSGNIG